MTRWLAIAEPEVVAAMSGPRVTWAHVQVGEVGDRRVVRVFGVRVAPLRLGPDGVAERVRASLRWASVVHVDAAEDWTRSPAWGASGVGWRVAALDRRDEVNAERHLRLMRGRAELRVERTRIAADDVHRVLLLLAHLDSRGELGTQATDEADHEGGTLIGDRTFASAAF